MKQQVIERLYNGMSDEQKKRLNDFNMAQEWRVQCWNCRGINEVHLDALGDCKHCGKPLGRRV